MEHVEFLQEKHLEEIVMANAPKQLFSIPDELWEKIQPLLPDERQNRRAVVRAWMIVRR